MVVPFNKYSFIPEFTPSGFEDQNHVAGGLVLCALRSYPREHGLETAALAARYIGGGAVLAMDVAGFEGGFPLKCGDDSMDAGVRCDYYTRSFNK